MLNAAKFRTFLFLLLFLAKNDCALVQIFLIIVLKVAKSLLFQKVVYTSGILTINKACFQHNFVKKH